MRVKLPFPVGGLSENFAFDEQPPATSRDIRNCRIKDPRTDRQRGASRGGHTKLCPVQVGAGGPVKRIQDVVYEGSNQSYADQASTAPIEWSAATPAKADIKGACQDSEGNQYVLNGAAGISKFNSSGVLIWTITLPAKDKAHVCQAVRVDPNTRLVFAGISTGGPQATASLFCYQQQDNNTNVLLWQVDPGGFVTQIRVYGGNLYVLLNFPDRNRSYVRVYESLLSTQPIQQKEWLAMSNARDFGISPVDGNVFVANGEDAQRGLDPRAPGTSTQSTDWTPEANLAHYSDRVWSRIDASNRDSLSLASEGSGLPDEGGEVVIATDLTGKGRSWIANRGISAYPPVPATEAGPTYKTVGIGGLPSLSFSGAVYNGSSTAATSGRSMVGQGASSTDRAYRNEQLSPIPTYKGAQFAVFMVVKAAIDDTNIRGLLSIPTTANNSLSKILSINRRDDNNLPGTIPMPGSVSLRDPGARASDVGASTPPAGGPSGPNNVSPGSLSGSGIAVITWICDGGVHDGNSTNGLTGLSSRSVLRVNGHPCDRWQSAPFNTAEAMTLGLANLGISGHSRFGGLIAEIIVLSDWYDQNGNQQQLITCPAYPDSNWAANGDTEVERIEGYLAHKWGFAHELETGQAAWATMTGASVNDQLTIDAKTYRFVTTLSQPNDVKIGSDLRNTLGNLYQAINRIGNPGVDYDQRTEKHQTFIALAPVEQGASPNLRMAIRSISPYAAQTALANGTGNRIVWDNGSTRLTINGSGGDNGWYPHPFTLKKTTNSRGGPPGTTTNTQAQVSTSYLLQSPYPALSKWSSNTGQPLWVATSGYDVSAHGTSTISTQGSGLGGVGRAVSIGSKGQVYSVGDEQPAIAGSEGILADAVDIRRIADNGSAFSTTGTDPWFAAVLPAGTAWESTIIRTDVDAFDNLYVPVLSTASGPLQTISVLGYRAAGLAGLAQEFMRYSGLPTDQEAYVVNVSQDKPDFVPGSGIDHAEFLYVGVQKDPADTANLSLFKLRMVATSATSGSIRASKTIAVVAGSVYRIDGSAATLIGTGMDPAAQYIDCAVVLGKVFLTDGRKMFVYDPKLDTLSPYRPTSSGEFLPTCKILASWSGRLVGCRPSNNGHNWFMSKQGDPFDCNVFPFTVTESQAVEGGDSRTGTNPDIINGFFPVRDDLAFVLCDHSIHRFTGDPMAGGTFHPISWTTGGSFGRSACSDPFGNFYFFSSRGGVYRIAPNASDAESITVNKIQKRLRGVDLSQYRVELLWSTEEDALRVFVVPFGNGGTHVQSYTWERSTQAWTVDEFGTSLNTTVQPTCAQVLDSDSPDDRKVAMGCEDGFIRFYDETATSDDGVAIESYALIGPIVPDNEGTESMFTDWEIVMDRTQQAPHWYLYASDTANDPGDIVTHGDLRVGRTKLLDRVRSAAVWLAIGNADPDACWAVESIAARAEPMGITRAIG